MDQRLNSLEATVRQMQERQSPQVVQPLPPLTSEADPNAAAQAPAAPAAWPIRDGAPADSKGSRPDTISPPTFAGWDKGFFLRSPNQDFSLRLTGQIQTDYRSFLSRGDTTDTDTFLLRRARLGIEADVYDVFEFRLLPDFGQSQPTIQDAYVNVHYRDDFQFEVGKFKQPFSYEQLIQDRFVPFMERSMIDQLVPARDEGAMIHGEKLLGNRLDYGISICNGETNGNADTNDRKDLVGRVVVCPFADSDSLSQFQYLQVGFSVTTGIEQEPIAPPKLTTPSTVPWLVFNNGVRADGLRDRLSPEISYFYGPFGFASQYFWMRQDIQPAPVGPTTFQPVAVPFNGFYVMSTLLLTGETRTTYSQPIVPIRPFEPGEPIAGPGAWELVGRVSRVDVGSIIFASGPTGLANPALYSSGATEMTLGFNWYLNQWVRTQINWEHAWFDDPVQLGSGTRGLMDHHDTLMTRFQVIF